ncbi:MAG TPA: hypothetical protein VEU33_20925 [Archangium sp.]|nr:hypothetical protein [Archangium sp.]
MKTSHANVLHSSFAQSSGGVRLLCGSSRPGANDGFPSCSTACCLAGAGFGVATLVPAAMHGADELPG